MRIAHIGNIANNAYCEAYNERIFGLESYVFDVDLNDRKSTPGWEWELTPEKVKDYVNPSWYYRGSWIQIMSQYQSSVPLIESWSADRSVKLKKFLPPNFASYASNEIRYRFRNFRLPQDLRSFLLQFDVLVFYGPYTALAHTLQISKPYIAVEHGTLDNFCRGRFSYCKDSLSGYLSAKFVILTNQEAFQAAKNFGINDKKLIRACHPNIDVNTTNPIGYRKRLGNNKFRILCPARHVYSSAIEHGKGFDVILKALYDLALTDFDFDIVFIEHGETIEKTKKIISQYKLNNKIVWYPIQTRLALKNMMFESDLVIDQALAKSYGTIAADAITLGIPCLTAHSCELDKFHFGSCSPVHQINPNNDFSSALKRFSLNHFDVASFSTSSQQWASENIAPKICFDKFKEAYSRLII